jgi:hypothetical protein
MTIGVPVSSGTIYCAVPIPLMVRPDAITCRVVCWMGLIGVMKSAEHGETPILAPVLRINMVELDRTCLRSRVLCRAYRLAEGTTANAAGVIGWYWVGMVGTGWAGPMARAW